MFSVCIPATIFHIRSPNYNLVVLQDAHWQEEPHLQEAPQQDLVEVPEEAVEVVVEEALPHML